MRMNVLMNARFEVVISSAAVRLNEWRGLWFV